MSHIDHPGSPVMTWLLVLLAVILAAIEARRLLLGHLRRERLRAMLARAAVVTVGCPEVFKWSVGMNVAFHMLSSDIDHQDARARPNPFERVKGHVIKINYATGKLWVLDA